MQNQGFPPKGRLVARAPIMGGSEYPGIAGEARFYEGPRNGTVLEVQVIGLPRYTVVNGQPIGPFGFHIHQYGSCEPHDGDDPFSAAGSHYNPTGAHHGNHAGDLPVLFSNNGVAMMSVYTSAFSPGDVVGRTIMIHENPDDFRTDPAGNSGRRIACGVIRRVGR